MAAGAARKGREKRNMGKGTANSKGGQPRQKRTGDCPLSLD